ncbi:UDP-2,3-diacylglucosamine diphosphatase LpxI [Alphaproteobacteria bacterium]|nr:UDP-2,3-diacylglucosamine diphosphatase LpxI [Alphaproteobacteria bacterium]
MKNLVTYKNDICLIAGSGLFVNEVANYLNSKKLLGQIIIINENKSLEKNFKNNFEQFNVKNLEKIISFIKSRNLKKIIVIGYVDLPSLDKINLSFRSKLLISKDIFLNNINDQSKILKKYLLNNKLSLLSQKKLLKEMLVTRNDEYVHKENKKIVTQITKKKVFIRKLYSMNIGQSFIFNGDRLIAMEDIFGTNDMITRIGKISSKFNNLIFVKSKKYDQIDEIDFPVIGLVTLKLLIKYKFRVICLFKNNILISEKEKFLKQIKTNKISLLVM